MRKHIYRIIAKATADDRASAVYDWFIMAVSLISILPMMTRNPNTVFFHVLETSTVYVLFFDYLLRWITYDYRLKSHSPLAFVLYPITPLALMDILGLLPSLGLLPASFRVLRLLRLSVLLRFSRSARRIANVFRRQWHSLCSVLVIAMAYIFISALIMFVSEPAENFPNFFDALYWATTALTTVGYGDIYPCTQIGKLVSMVSSLFGVAVIAMPAGIVTAGFMDELQADERSRAERQAARLVPSAEPAPCADEKEALHETL